MTENAELKAEVARLRGALEFYADEEEWIDFKAVCADGTEVNSHFDKIQGQRARDALSAASGEALAAVRGAINKMGHMIDVGLARACNIPDCKQNYPEVDYCTWHSHFSRSKEALAELKRVFGDV